ncbi:restriction endonuclease [Thermodesulfobacteriota bacterium]
MLDIAYHYPPELFQLLVDTIPKLCKSKRDLTLFFRGAGVPERHLNDIEERVARDRDNINKYEIVRTILQRLNEFGEHALRERREILKRVVEFEDFSTCWDNDRLEAKGLVSEIRKVINVKDSFTRMRQERDMESQKHRDRKMEEVKRIQEKKEKIESVKNDLSALFGMTDPHKRGTALEGVLNNIFKVHGISIRESFKRVSDKGHGVIEQIDGVIEIDGEIYLVEMKWLSTSVGKGDVANHLVNIFNRRSGRGIFISASDYTEPAIKTCEDSLSQVVVILCKLQEIVMLLERGDDFVEYIRDKVRASIVDKNPYKTYV